MTVVSFGEKVKMKGKPRMLKLQDKGNKIDFRYRS